MQPFQFTDLVANLVLMKATSKEKQSGLCKNLSEGELIIDEKVAVYKGINGNAKMKQRTSDGSNGCISKYYKIDDCLLHNFTLEYDLNGTITLAKTVITSPLSCSKSLI